ncbi:RluA family pseudouridine synthase [Tenacibaculum crassostreae]|uniref:RluA family pseudouridine synthase n=1 Tax=Tenacibaculum crassostreae TaxID=502683 RepID=UPI0038938606
MTKILSFSSDISSISLPDKFTYPYNYIPHKLAKIASEELQAYLQNQTDFIHDFGINTPENENALGKMFGVLVVQQSNGNLGYLTAFSGKLADNTQHKHFVPPVFDVLDKNGFYLKTEDKLNQLSLEIETLEESADYIDSKNVYNNALALNATLLSEEQNKIKLRRKKRKELKKQNNQQNINEEFYLREYEVYLNEKTHPLKVQFECFQLKINDLKKERANLSARVQHKIFEQYQFLNSNQEVKNLLNIFDCSQQNIPAGAGDCCAPKLLQYAFKHDLKPICMAEFWWGKPLNTSIRKHQNYYPACTGKCKPILTHMLKEMLVDENPLTAQLNKEKELKIIYEDEDLVVLNKPHELLTVSGKEFKDSVYSRVKKLYPNATGPLVVHRLDMSTSGILLIAKSEETYKHLQAQFINKTIKKRYVALLDGILQTKKGEINLPIRVDLDDRPKQLVCYEHGKKAFTKWETVEVINNKTKVYFYPITGRTHQLRVHSAHNLGLNTAIVGDDLYGEKSDRLYLHAEKITFIHPTSKKEISFTSSSPF